MCCHRKTRLEGEVSRLAAAEPRCCAMYLSVTIPVMKKDARYFGQWERATGRALKKSKC